MQGLDKLSKRLMPALTLLMLLALSTGMLVQAQEPEFRAFDGSGNNVASPTWGSGGIQLMRIEGAAYEDGFSEPRGGGMNSAATLPSARLISNEVAAQAASLPHSEGVSSMVWQWGQFIDHDIDLTGSFTPAQPFAITVPTADPFFDPTSSGTAEIGLNRSLFDESTGTSNARQQLNQITAWVDGSQVYGSDVGRADWKRAFAGGKLSTSDGNLLPFEPQECPETNGPCFAAGDIRANEQLGLTAMHTLFVREHNRLADLIAADNPALNDEEIYQRARAIVAAEIQIITYNEFLTLLLGANGLPSYAGYDAQVNPNINNEFSTAAYRFGHTMLPSQLLRLDENGNEITNGHVALRDAFFNPSLVVEDGIEPILRGLVVQSAQEIDTQVVDEVRNFLFGPPGSGGFDLASLNIQRGREHGLPSYNAVRLSLGLASANSFADITSDAALQSALASAYNNDVAQVDLWVGGLAEDHLDGALVGETFHAIIANQFTRLRDGDRFWHQNIAWTSYGFASDPIINPDGTTLSEINLSEIMQWNSTISNLQEDVFLATGLTISNDNNPIYPGDTFTVTLTAHGNDFYGLQANCATDAAIFAPQRGTFGEPFTSQAHLVAANQSDSAAGRWFGALTLRSPAEALAGQQQFATLTYQAGNAGSATITCQPLFADRNGLELVSRSSPVTITIAFFGSLAGTVAQQGSLDHPNITISATNTDTNATHTSATDREGNFDIPELIAGNYNIQADAERYLPSCTSADISAEQVTTLSPATLRGGDVNDDEIINIADASLLTGVFGENAPPADIRADINNDGVVNIQDFSILGGNYQLAGCQAW